MKTVLILEDNDNTLNCLEKIVKQINSNVKVFGIKDVKEAYQCMLEYTVDLFIIDIILNPKQAGDTSGLYFAEKVRMLEKYLFTPMIFITSLEDSRYITYEKLHCYSFIEKPFAPDRVKNIISQCLKYSDNTSTNNSLFFRSDGVIFSVSSDEIIYVESIHHVLWVHLKNGEIVKIPYITMKAFLKYAADQKMLQCSRNVCINSLLIKNMDFTNRVIELNTGHRVEIGLKYKKALKDLIHVSNNYICG